MLVATKSLLYMKTSTKCSVKLQFGNPMSRTDLQDAILDNSPQLGTSRTIEDLEKMPLSIVVIGDRGWSSGGSSYSLDYYVIS